MGSFPRVTHPCATKAEAFVRLACVRHAASVRSEPGSNSQVDRSDPKIGRHGDSVQAIHITLERTLYRDAFGISQKVRTLDHLAACASLPSSSLVKERRDRSLAPRHRVSARWGGRGFKPHRPGCQHFLFFLFPHQPAEPGGGRVSLLR